MSDSKDAPADDGTLKWFKEHGSWIDASEFWWHVEDLNNKTKNLGSNTRTAFRSADSEIREELSALRAQVAELAASAPAVGMQRTGSSSAKYAHEVQALRGELAHIKVDFAEKLGFLTAELVAENATMRAAEESRAPSSVAPEVARLRAISRAQSDQFDAQAILNVNAPMTQEDAFELAVFRKLVQRRFIRQGTQGMYVCLPQSEGAQADQRNEMRRDSSTASSDL
ncbi:hypothetical protein CYMTET_5053 [Cymbomonas tetramitiformis]|uniref:Uncharacterized protein n=1 Tax=Cymbomonas tetramitiformis TaxID=36881 RepID=A0AAE0GZY3_9CHLO|nr:hypothetical protein CYMTET_45432 [Cymbomonas tetramitiformis]KAK3287437.1 hypothetical protein CYMTET_5053 [Cymbomonas tetramitiformis]